MTAPERRSQRGRGDSLVVKMAQLGRGVAEHAVQLLKRNAAVPKNLMRGGRSDDARKARGSGVSGA